MDEKTEVVTPGVANSVEPVEKEICLPCLVPEVISAWNSTRAACEYLPSDMKTKCREGMEAMAKNIKDIESGEEVIYRAITASEDPTAFIEAQVAFAKTHNRANAAAILKWAEEQEAANIPIPEKIMSIIKIYRLEAGI